MPRTSVKTNKLSIYMIKSQFERLEDIISTPNDPVNIEGVGDFFYERSSPRVPAWVRSFFGTALDNEEGILTSSAKGVLLVPIRDGEHVVRFAIAFGTGRYLLKEGVTEDRFGLKVVLNSADPESLRSIDKTTLGTVPKHSREQMTREVNASEFGIDIEQDLLTSVTAKSLDKLLGKIPSGRDALSLNVQIDTGNIVSLLEHCLQRYRSSDYKTNFGWIDQIAEVRDKTIVATLQTKLAEKLSRRELDKIWLAVPEVVEWADIEGFRYLTPKTGELVEDIGMESFLDSLGGRPITAETLDEEPIFMVSAQTGDTVRRWSAYRCTYAEIDHDDKLFILNNGQWYEIAKSFTDLVLEDYRRFARSPVALPDCVEKNEGAYNTATALALGFCCLDGNLIVHGGGHSKVEFCDLLTPDKKIIHIKKYGGSSPLSHLFAQGVVSGELFARDPDFRRKVNDKLPTAYKLANADVRPKLDEYEVIYGIISYSSKPDIDIPFFSKVSLRNARNRLELCGYKVSLKKITKVELTEAPTVVVGEVVVV